MVLRVVLQIVPFGDETKVREIGRLDIFNKGPWDVEDIGRHEYGVIDLSPEQEGLHKKTAVHFRKDGAWELVRNVIETLEIEGP